MKELEGLKLHKDTDILYKGVLVNGDTLRPESPPLYATTAFMLEDATQQQQVLAERGYNYLRGTNPTRDALGELISDLEGGEKTLLFSFGMGAISATLFTFVKSGDHVVASKDLYGETLDLLENYLAGFGVETTFVSFSDLDAVKSAIRPNTKLLYSEVISNPCTEVVDLPEIVKIAHEAGVLYCVDSTFTTPYVVQPLQFGVDLVIHSLTKYYNGHSDAAGGSVTCKKEYWEQIRSSMLLMGNSLDPYSSWMILRGTRTMGMRVRKQNENAIHLAAYLASHPQVRQVYHPSLPAHPQHELARQLFHDGYYGAIVSFSLDGGIRQVDRLMHALKLVTYLPSLGGYRTTLSHPASSSHHDVPEEVRKKMGIDDGLIRISVGCEDIHDLIDDFASALEALS